METVAAYAVVDWYHGLANSSMTDEQRASLSPDSDEYHWRVGGSKVQVIGWSLYVTTLWLLKVCMLVFYSRLTYVSIYHIRTFLLSAHQSDIYTLGTAYPLCESESLSHMYRLL